MALTTALLLVSGASALSLALGIFLGHALRGRRAQELESKLRAELGSFREEHETHKRRVTEHFSRSSDLFRDLTRHHAALYMHLAEGAREFCPEASPSLRAELRMLLAEGSPEASAGARPSAVAFESARPGPERPVVPAQAPARTEVIAVETGVEAREESAARPDAAASREPVGARTAQVGERVEREPERHKGSDESFSEWYARLQVRKNAADGRYASGYERAARDRDPETSRHGLREAVHGPERGSRTRSDPRKIAAAA